MTKDQRLELIERLEDVSSGYVCVYEDGSLMLDCYVGAEDVKAFANILLAVAEQAA